MAEYAYFLCGLKVASVFRLPELPMWPGSAYREPDIRFLLGRVPQIQDVEGGKVRFRGQGKSCFLLNLDSIGRIKISDGKTIIVDPIIGTESVGFRVNFIGTVQAVLWFQRGLLALHASAVLLSSRAVAIAGPSGVGKSVFAASLRTLGHKIISDDFGIINLDAEEPMLLPGYQRLRLWDDAYDALGLSDIILGSADPSSKKYILDDLLPIVTQPAPLSDVLVLERGSEEYQMKRLPTVEAVTALLKIVHTPSAVRALGLQGKVFLDLNRIALGSTRIWKLIIPTNINMVRNVAADVADKLLRRGDLADLDTTDGIRHAE